MVIKYVTSQSLYMLYVESLNYPYRTAW